MRTLGKIALVVALMSHNFLDVQIFGEGCHLDATYVAEQVFVSADKAYMDIYQANGQFIHVPFKFGVSEIQVSFKGFFRSYVLEDGKVVEKTTPLCKGSI